MEQDAQDLATSEPPTPIPAEPTLFALLATVARRFSDTQLVSVAGVATLTTVASLLFSADWWRVALLGAATALLAVWAIVERDTGERQSTIARRAVQGLAAGLGLLCVFVLALSVLTSTLGLWRS